MRVRQIVEAANRRKKRREKALSSLYPTRRSRFFFAALFSQFIQPEAAVKTQLIIAATAAVIDALWYTMVAVLLPRPAWSGRFMQHGGLLDRAFGVILIMLSAAVLWPIWQPI